MIAGNGQLKSLMNRTSLIVQEVKEVVWTLFLSPAAL